MPPDEADEHVATRAEPLPEERAVERGDEDRRAAAAEILHDSEQRVAEAARATRPTPRSSGGAVTTRSVTTRAVTTRCSDDTAQH